MRFIPMLISASFLVSSVLARRAHDFRLSQPHNSAKGASSKFDVMSSNVAGAYYHNVGLFFDSLLGGFSVPDLSGQRNTSITIFLGIDSDGGCSLFATGVEISVNHDGQATYQAFYETQHSVYYLEEIEISPGDNIQALVSTMSDGSSGDMYLSNGKATGYRHIHFSPPTCGQMVGWYVLNGAKDTAPPNFGSLNFVNAKAGVRGGMVYGPWEARIFEMVSSKNQNLTSTSVNNDSVTISYEFFGI